ncbi:hypothetical protein GCM10009681_44180 [Luedemannella helvata]|uniref:Uncharacterized protein n=2 Tax=Luedemannella helvata TaxID=349315 RepID=A0ABP4X558_9ACTN
MRAVLGSEKKRWLGNLDDATQVLVDIAPQLALTYPGIRLPARMARQYGSSFNANPSLGSTAIEYAVAVRLVWLSNLPLARRLELVTALSGTIKEILYARPSRRAFRFVSNLAEVNHLIAEAIESVAKSDSVAGEDGD